MGRIVEAEDRIRIQRTWLRGRETGRFAVLLDFAAGGTSFSHTLPVSTVFQGELSFYPAAQPLRAIIKNRSACPSFSPKFDTLASAHRAYRQTFARFPSMLRFPMLLGNVTAEYLHPAFRIRDDEGKQVPLRVTPVSGWKLLAIGGGVPVPLFGEWDGSALRPLTVWQEGVPITLEEST